MGPDAAVLVGLLAEDDRLRVVAALVLGTQRHADLVGVTGLDSRRVTAALDRLTSGGLIEPGIDGSIRLRAEVFKDAARTASAAVRRVTAEAFDGVAPETAAVLRNFVADGRLQAIPTQRSKRRLVLDWLASRFEPGEVYHEPEVNRILAVVHADVAALRRYLVDEDFMERRDGFYWRTGGSVDTNPDGAPIG